MGRLRTRADTADTAHHITERRYRITGERRGHSGIPARPAATEVRRLDYVVDSDERLVTIVGEYGDAEDWKTLLARILHDSRVQPGFAFFRDRRGATSPIDIATVIGVMDAIRRFWPDIRPSRAAIMIARESELVAIAAQTLATSCGLSIRAFTSYEEARAWLRQRSVS